MEIILPKTFVAEDAYKDKRLFFLAGPVRGGGDWQWKMVTELYMCAPDSIVAIPQRYEETHPLNQARMDGDETKFERQLAWEQYYLRAASRSGGVVFWLPCESTENPHPGPEPYGMDTRGELGEWRTRKEYEPDVRLFIGGDPLFHGFSQIQRNCWEQLGKDFPFYSSLRDLAQAATSA